jgi:hypothetical protein
MDVSSANATAIHHGPVAKLLAIQEIIFVELGFISAENLASSRVHGRVRRLV